MHNTYHKKSKTSSLLFLALFLVVAGAVIAYTLFGNEHVAKTASPLQSSNEGASSVTTAETQPASDLSNKFLRLLLSVNSINLSNELFAKPAYLALKDFSVVLESDGNEGRPNPFAPFGVDSGVPQGGTISFDQSQNQNPVTNPTQNTSGQGTQSPVITNQPTGITATGAILSGVLAQGVTATERYFEYGVMTQPPFDRKTDFVAQNPVTGQFAKQVTGLLPNTTYNLRAVTKIGGQVVAGPIVTFKTLPASN